MTANLEGVERRVVTRRRVAVLAAASSLLAWVGLLLAVPSAAAESGTVTVPDSAEAWYSDVPIDPCSLPIGCLPGEPPEISPYPADTLHVGVAGGQETARTYVVPDLSKVPFGAELEDGTMTVPVATGTLDGSAQYETATLQACLVLGQFTDGAAGSIDNPPAIACDVNAVAEFVEDDEDGPRFTIPLRPFLREWQLGSPRNGVALVPLLEDAGPTTTWHVTVDGKEREGGRPIASTVSYEIPDQPTGPPTASPTPEPSAAPPPPSTSQPPPITSGGPGPLPPVDTPPTPAVVAPPAPQVAVSAPVDFQYPAAFLLPLAFLAAAVFLFRLFTADPTPVEVRA